MDKFRVEVLRSTPNPQQTIWSAMHQDYCEEFVWEQQSNFPDEQKAGELIVKHLLAGGRGHYGPLEHPQIVFNVGYFPHSMMQQIRTHRVGVSFDVQSFRYTGQRIIDVAEGKRDVEEVFYLRPVGKYDNRQGKKYFYSEEQRNADKEWCLAACDRYRQRIEEGLAEEHARSLIPFDARQHFVMSCNVRSLMHLLDLRWKKDAQLEAQQLCELLFVHFETWCPEIAAWYHKNRAQKARLSP
ncbi:FAD-dependent thymidylate synthase [Synechococcus sp. BDU 130192]|uniref:FAD-dependent thymidylate synthase n=1 Tax=Synechococcus sp. BDU 130192 TaxID=2042059 RepID=UPI000C07E12A|nr:FAD-dependent thymidylate synthase [Synechococcus sp. BDU 130192]